MYFLILNQYCFKYHVNNKLFFSIEIIIVYVKSKIFSIII